MTRKDYVLIARAIESAGRAFPRNDSRESALTHGAIGVAAVCLARELAADNPRFDRERFLKACGVNDND